jgi:hypothetical protein
MKVKISYIRDHSSEGKPRPKRANSNLHVKTGRTVGTTPAPRNVVLQHKTF